jgi:Zn-dependent protease with chaperone function/Flp pilus assembly protein TadD
VDLWRGYIARLRGDTQRSNDLFRSATEAHPLSAHAATAYLMYAIPSAAPDDRVVELAEPFANRFPRDAHIQVLYAAALYRDKQFRRAAETLRRAKQLDEKDARFLGDKLFEAIEQGRHISPDVSDGLDALDQRQFDRADSAFRKALAIDPQNPLAARFLSRSIVSKLLARQPLPEASLADPAVEEITALSSRFPDDAEIQGALAVALHLNGRNVEAARALDRMQQLGLRPEKMLPPDGVRAIRDAAQTERATRLGTTIALATVGGAAAWIVAMFAMGLVLAAAIPRVPPPEEDPTGLARSGREIWLERFYLVVLSLGLLIFYASVPVVALGLLAVTLAIFALFLVIRIIHYGVLHRGLWATWNVLRCALIGPRREVLGIEATPETHPKLFETNRAVADRLETRPVDTIYLTPSANISVYQKGAGPFGLLGKRQRVLEIGISTLPLLSREEFSSILAHEYGHFSHNDTFYSRFIFQVSASLATSLAVMNAAGGFLNYINPFYWFWWLYLRAYTLLSAGFSRSRESLADRRAAAAFGKSAFTSGLTKVSVDGVLFESTIYANVQHQLSQGRAFVNAFEAFRDSREDLAEPRQLLMEQLQTSRPGWFDSHPTYAERIAAVETFPDSARPAQTGPAIELLSDPDAVEAELTQLLTGYVGQLCGVRPNPRSSDADAED